jgi:diguanylate cyclase (GGDEF)-like protein
MPENDTPPPETPPAAAAGPTLPASRGWPLVWLAMALPIAVVSTQGSVWMWLLVMIWLTLGIVLGLGLVNLADALQAQVADLSARLSTAQSRIDTLATRDELTGVWNHKQLGELLTQQLAQARRTGEPLCLALVEVDHLPAWAAEHGQHVTDELLRRFAQATQAVLRASDFAGRTAYARFVLVMPATLPAEAQVALQRLRDRLVAQDLTDLSPGLSLRCSGGLVRMTPTDTQDTAMARAAEALQRAVAAGRDMIELA